MVKVYENAKQFLAETETALLEREAVAQLLLGNAVQTGERKSSPDCMFGTVWIGERMVLAFCNCLPWNLIICTISWQKSGTLLLTEEKAVAQASEELAQFMKEKEIFLNGINANGVVCRHFLTNYYVGKRIARKKLSMDIMECRTLRNIEMQEGIYRSAGLKDLEWILEGCLAFEKEALGADGNREELRENIIKYQIGEEQVRLFCLPDNTPVCMAKKAVRSLKNGMCITQVYTQPGFRGRGYAQTLIYKMCREFFRDGYSFVTLFVDKTNPISNRVYEKVGFVILEDNYDYRFTEEI